MLGLGRNNVWDLSEETIGDVYELYFLEDPRTNLVCYVGLTKQNFNKRLMQHRSPIKSNNSKLAKLQRHLKCLNLTLDGYVVAKASKDLIGALEKWYITGIFSYLGKDSIKNIQSGGFDNYGDDLESKNKRKETIIKRVEEGTLSYAKGEEIGNSVLKEEDVLFIYKMIKDFYGDYEIQQAIESKIKMNAITAIRQGKNWKHLWKQEKMEYIPSMGVYKGGISSRDKIFVIESIEAGKENSEIMKRVKIQSTDLNKIRTRALWKQVWNVYDNYINKK